MKQAKALIIDDEPDILQLITITMQRMNIVCQTAANVTDAIELLNSNAFDLCLTDMKLPDGDGMEIVSHIQDTCPKTPVAINPRAKHGHSGFILVKGLKIYYFSLL